MKQKPLYRRIIIAVAQKNYAKEYLTLTPLSSECTLNFEYNYNMEEIPRIYYSFDKKNWSELTSTYINVPTKVYLRGKNPAGVNKIPGAPSRFLGNGEYDISGNIMSLIDYDDMNAPMVGTFSDLFYQDSEDDDYYSISISSAKNLILPTEITPNAFKGMFGNNNLKEAPVLNFKQLVEGACEEMFQGNYNLSYIEVSFDEWVEGATDSWVDGVAASGTFICPEALPKEFGTSKIPTGWTVVTK